MPHLISIVGPTAAGKTAWALDLARHWGCPIVSADSVQIYKRLDIGSGKVTKEEMGEVPHHLLDFLPLEESYSTGHFERDALAVLAQLFVEHDKVVIVGGTGFYFQAVWEGLDEMPEIDPEKRHALNLELVEKGLEPLVDELKVVDPETWEKIDRRNPARVIRALEVWRSVGQPISSFRQGKGEQRPWSDFKIGLDMPRADLYARIEKRIDLMLEAGWLEEVKAILADFPEGCTGLEALGYRELHTFLKGEYGWEECLDHIKRNTRRYAKRQLTWFRRYADIHWFSPEEYSVCLEQLKKAGLY